MLGLMLFPIIYIQLLCASMLHVVFLQTSHLLQLFLSAVLLLLLFFLVFTKGKEHVYYLICVKIPPSSF